MLNFVGLLTYSDFSKFREASFSMRCVTVVIQCHNFQLGEMVTSCSRKHEQTGQTQKGSIQSKNVVHPPSTCDLWFLDVPRISANFHCIDTYQYITYLRPMFKTQHKVLSLSSLAASCFPHAKIFRESEAAEPLKHHLTKALLLGLQETPGALMV